ncbi:hypothetical protein HX866_16115 [Pseudomonas gingeri]|uniref:hypothetical protein n=1 Tax=Pseudomonas gingeri TaxID=117681 RepID=UPI0015A2FF9E|nr:hypothetical protein [Pseudomonas gingeri]NWA26416.1 hypothetical protein [Pseudomonas gingeri]
MDDWLGEIRYAAGTGASAPYVRSRRHPLLRVAPRLVALPSELAFWALWHCRHARPPDVGFPR